MALYQYECENCKQVEERFVPAIARDQQMNCPKCGHPLHRKLGTFTNILFKAGTQDVSYGGVNAKVKQRSDDFE